MAHWKSLVVFFLITFAAAATGSISTPDAWFNGLNKPWFNPPPWVFAPVWTVLYVLMAIAAWRVYRITRIGPAIVLWVTQLVFNAGWTPLFFGAHRIDLALADVVVLGALIVATIIAFYRKDRVAAFLLMPYLAWAGFATVLTLRIWQLNT